MFDQATLQQLEAGYQTAGSQPQVAPKKKSNPLLSALPSAAAAAASLIPGVGTLTATALGGAGEVARQKLAGEEFDLGKVGREAALSAIPGGIGKGIKLAKDARATKTAVDTGAVVAKTAKPSLLSKLSSASTKRASGIKTDPGVGGIDRADEAAATFQRLGISGTPTQQLRKINQVMTTHGKQVDDILAKNPIQLDGKAVRTQVQQALDDPLKYPDLDLSTAGSQKVLNAHLDKFAASTNAKEVNDYIKKLNPIAIRAKSKLDRGLAVTDKEAAALAAKRAGDEVLSQYPEIAPLKKDMATLFDRNADVTKQSEKAIGIPILGIKSKTLANGLSVGTSGLGKAAQKLDKVSQSATTQTIKRGGKSLLGQLTTRAIAAPTLDQSENSPTNQNIADTTSDTTMIPASSSNMDALYNNSQQNASNGIDYETAAMDALSKGDYKAFDAIMQLADRQDKRQSTGTKGLNSTASGVIADTTTGLRSLTELQGKIAESSANNPGVGWLRGKNPLDTNAQNLQASIATAKQIVGKALEGGVLRAEDEKKYAKILPTLNDTDAVASHKIDELVNLISSRLSEYKANISGGSGGLDASELGLAGAQ